VEPKVKKSKSKNKILFYDWAPGESARWTGDVKGLLGYSINDIKGGWDDLIHPDDFDRYDKAWDKSLSTGEAYCQEYRIRNHKGKYIKVRDQGFALRRIIGIIEIL
jgi:PAS domain-containing protein